MKQSKEVKSSKKFKEFLDEDFEKYPYPKRKDKRKIKKMKK